MVYEKRIRKNVFDLNDNEYLLSLNAQLINKVVIKRILVLSDYFITVINSIFDLK